MLFCCLLVVTVFTEEVNFFSLSALDINGKEIYFKQYIGKVWR